jgi:hypothetical protein
MNGKTKAAPRRKYSKGWEVLSEACRRTTKRRMSEGFVGQCILAKRLTLAFGVGSQLLTLMDTECDEEGNDSRTGKSSIKEARR